VCLRCSAESIELLNEMATPNEDSLLEAIAGPEVDSTSFNIFVMSNDIKDIVT
jgi:hypothetical protein